MRCPRLEAIVSFGVGYDAIALDAARARGIQVSNTPDVLNDCVADLAFGLLLDAARGIAHGDRFVRAGRRASTWRSRTTPPPARGAPWRFEPDLKALAAWADFLVVATVGGVDGRAGVARGH